MSPPVQKPTQTRVDPMAEELPPPPPPVQAEPAPAASAEPVPAPAPVGEDLTIAPSTDGVAPATPPAAPAVPSEFSKKFHLLVSGGYSAVTRFYVDHPDFRDAAPEYSGGHLGAQATYPFYQEGALELRAGAGGSVRLLRIPRSAGSVDSNAQIYTLGLAGEANYSLTPKLGLGLNGTIDGALLSGNPVDVGAAHTADFGGIKTLSVGAAAYFSVKSGVIRGGVGIDWMPFGFPLPTGPGSSDLNIDVEPQLKVFLGFDLFQALK